jgi:hypothetical protein
MAIPVEQRLAIWERDLYVCHGVGGENFLGGLSDQPAATITAVDPDGHLHIRVHAEEFTLGPRFIRAVLLGFRTVRSVREEALRFALAASDPDVTPSPSLGVNYGLITPN